MDEYGVLELPAPVTATDGTFHGRGADLCDSLIYETRGPDDRREVIAAPARVLADSEVTRLQRVLEDVRFSLERGCWQAALAMARAALTATRRPSDESAAHDHRGQGRVVPRRRR